MRETFATGGILALLSDGRIAVVTSAAIAVVAGLVTALITVVALEMPALARIHGGHFVGRVRQSAGANHIHSVWREMENDFPQDVLREHLLLYHVI